MLNKSYIKHRFEKKLGSFEGEGGARRVTAERFSSLFTNFLKVAS